MAITERYASRTGSGANDGLGESTAWTLQQAVTAVNALGAGGGAGLRINYKKDGTTDSQSDNAIFSVGGSATSPFIIRAYLTNIGDYFLGRTNGSGPLIATNMPTISFAGGKYLGIASLTQVEGFTISGNVNAGLITASSTAGLLRGCSLTNAATGSSASAADTGAYSQVIGCDLALTGATGGAHTVAGGAASLVIGNRITCVSTGTDAIRYAYDYIVGNIFYNCGRCAIASNNSGALMMILGNTIVGCAGSGISITQNGGQGHIICNNLITDNTLYGIIAASAAYSVRGAYNRFDRNGQGATSGADDWLAGSGFMNNTTSVLQAAEYVAAASQDYRLLRTSPAVGAGLLPYRDIGAVQRYTDGDYSDPGVANVRNGTAYSYAAAALTGTAGLGMIL